MKYLVILNVQYNNGTADKKSIYELLDENDAVATFHSHMGSLMKDETVSHVLCLAINSEGGIYKNESWTRPTSELTD